MINGCVTPKLKTKENLKATSYLINPFSRLPTYQELPKRNMDAGQFKGGVNAGVELPAVEKLLWLW